MGLITQAALVQAAIDVNAMSHDQKVRLADEVYAQGAKNLAEFELYYGDAGLIRQELDRYLAVTSADIQQVAGRYFAETNRTVLDVVPPPREEAATAEGGAR